jgi:hypothetical protein
MMENENQEILKEEQSQKQRSFKGGAINPHLGHLNLQALVGRNAQEVQEELKAQKISVRVMKEDGESFIAIMNYNPGRVNLEVDNGIVTRSYGG